MSFRVIIPSRNIHNVAPCVRALLRCEPRAHIIVIDDGIEDIPLWFYESCDVIAGDKPFIFARNVNIGIQWTINDVVILGDDALLKTTGGLSLLSQSAEDHPEYGVIASTCNNVGNVNQRPVAIGIRDDGLREDRMVCFICAYIPRRTIDAVGLLDERFGGVDARGRTIYGWEDNDYCRRVRSAGLKIGIHDGCYCDHATLKSTFRGDPARPMSIQPGKDVYLAKWGSLD